MRGASGASGTFVLLPISRLALATGSYSQRSLLARRAGDVSPLKQRCERRPPFSENDATPEFPSPKARASPSTLPREGAVDLPQLPNSQVNRYARLAHFGGTDLELAALA